MFGIIKFVGTILALYIGAWFIPGVEISSLWTGIIVALLLAFINTFIKPILVLLTLPITIITLGLFLLVLNGLIILLVSALVPGFHVYSFFSAIILSIVVSLVSWFFGALAN